MSGTGNVHHEEERERCSAENATSGESTQERAYGIGWVCRTRETTQQQTTFNAREIKVHKTFNRLVYEGNKQNNAGRRVQRIQKKKVGRRLGWVGMLRRQWVRIMQTNRRAVHHALGEGAKRKTSANAQK